MTASTLSASQVQQYLADIFPQFDASIVHLDKEGAILELATDVRHLRPGGTVSGPTMMALADAAMYVAILGNIVQKSHSTLGRSALTTIYVHAPSPYRRRARAAAVTGCD